MSDEPRFGVAVSDHGCGACEHGRTWAVVDRVQDCELLGQAFLDQEDAEAIAEALNAAHECGRRAGHLDFAPFVARHETCRLADHACAECVPGGEVLIPGFLCTFHEAKRALADRGVL